MKVIDSSLLNYVSGGRGNNGGDRTDNGGRNDSARNSGRDSATYAGAAAGTAIGALAGGPVGGLIGGLIGTVAGGQSYDSAMGAVDKYGNNGNGGGAFGGDSNKNSVNGQCHW